MKEVKRVETPEEAALIKSQLESSGIDCFLKDNETVSVYSLYSNAVGGIKVLVPEEKETEAKELLQSASLEAFEKHCPHCDSQNIKYRKFGLLNGICIFSGFCLPSKRSTLFCQDCRMKFEASEMRVVEESSLPCLVKLRQEAESHTFHDSEEKALPDYFGILGYGFCSILIMLALSPVFYIHNGFLPTRRHYTWGIFAGILIGCLMKYSARKRKAGPDAGGNG
jgi:hypothetical protein